MLSIEMEVNEFEIRLFAAQSPENVSILSINQVDSIGKAAGENVVSVGILVDGIDVAGQGCKIREPR